MVMPINTAKQLVDHVHNSQIIVRNGNYACQYLLTLMIQDETPQQKYNSKHKQLEHNNKQYMMLDTMMQDTIS